MTFPEIVLHAVFSAVEGNRPTRRPAGLVAAAWNKINRAERVGGRKQVAGWVSVNA